MMSKDIIIIGAGIVGTALARELSRLQAEVMVLERASDVAEGATKANSGIVHAGYDALPGTQKAVFNVRGAAMYEGLCRSLGVSFRRCGALVIGFDEQDHETLVRLLNRGKLNGVPHLRIIEKEELRRMEPNLNPDVLYALDVPDSAIVSPYELAFAMADDAAMNGTDFRFGEYVTAVRSAGDGGGWIVETPQHEYRCRAVVNCAGASSADLHNMICDSPLRMVHRRGQYYLLDRSERQPFERTIFQCPGAMGKGVLVSPTVHGNLLLGPTAEDISDPLDTATTAEGLSSILSSASRTWPSLSVRTNITNFSGVRAHSETGDFSVGRTPGCVHAYEAACIESPGLSSAPAIAEYLCGIIADDLRLTRKKNLAEYIPRGKPFHEMNDSERARAVQENPQHGNIICRCEMVTEAEIREAIHRPVGARSIDGIKRRTRAGMGRCQGGFCMPRVAAILSEELQCSLLQICKDGPDSYLLADTVPNMLKGGGPNE